MQCVKQMKDKVANDQRRTVLAIVGDTQVGLWVVRSLARGGLTVHAVVRSKHGQAAHSRFTTSAWVLDTSPGDQGFGDEIKDLVRKVGTGSIMPVSEGFHNALIDLRDRFEPDVHIFSPSRECFDKATDKDGMHELCSQLGIPVAKGMRLDRLMADQSGSSLKLPLVLRTSRQNVQGEKASWKAAYARDQEQLQRLYDQVKSFADNVIVQEYHPGAEEHLQVLMHDGELFMVGDYIGEHHMPLAGGVTVQRISCHHQPVIDDTVRLLKAIDYEGIAGVQFHYDPATGKYIFLEVNPRFSGGLPTVIMAGFEAPFLLWQSRFEPEKMQKTDYRLGVRTRILGGDVNWMLGMLRGDELPPGQERWSKAMTVGSFLWNCGPWTRDDSFMWSDPMPFLADLRQMVKKLGSKKFDIIDNTS